MMMKIAKYPKRVAALVAEMKIEDGRADMAEAIGEILELKAVIQDGGRSANPLLLFNWKRWLKLCNCLN
jgi:hypothetical protein